MIEKVEKKSVKIPFLSDSTFNIIINTSACHLIPTFPLFVTTVNHHNYI